MLNIQATNVKWKRNPWTEKWDVHCNQVSFVILLKKKSLFCDKNYSHRQYIDKWRPFLGSKEPKDVIHTISRLFIIPLPKVKQLSNINILAKASPTLLPNSSPPNYFFLTLHLFLSDFSFFFFLFFSLSDVFSVMGVKVFMIFFMLTSTILFSLVYIPRKLSIPISNFRPIVNYLNIQKSNKSYPATFAYLISASKGDSGKLKRLLRALYHPGNYYLIHLDYGAPATEHRDVAKFVAGDPVFSQVGNVWVVKKPNLVTYRGPTMLATTLHAMAMLLRTCKWDWFINLSASDYPLITQDGRVSALFFFLALFFNRVWLILFLILHPKRVLVPVCLF